MLGQEQQENKQGKAVRERTFKVRLSESEYQLLDSNNHMVRLQSYLDKQQLRKQLESIIPKQKMTKKLKEQRLLNLRIARQSEH